MQNDQALTSVSEMKTIVDETAYRQAFEQRLKHYWPDLVHRLESVYTNRPDLDLHLSALKTVCHDAWLNRSMDLKELDRVRPAETLWYCDAKVVGASLYVDRFADTINGLRTRLSYLSDLGINYVHLMPIFRSPEGNSDGGYAVSSFRDLNPQVGHMTDLRALSTEMREKGMALVIDFVFNHTSDEHPWALKAKAGESRYLNFYRTFDSRSLIDAYQTTLREIFPTIRKGSYSWNETLRRWVWTSFNSFQWDLNYDNPDVFVHMVEEMLYLANCGIDVLRLDAVAFIWKRLGTDCENLPEAHLLIQALNLVCRIVTPAVIFKSEAIVHPDFVRSYIHQHECQISYNPNLMALLWESVATRQTKLLRQALSHRQTLPADTTWVNYLRCHDDIGWCFDDGDAAAVGINAFDHRAFLNQFYAGRFEGSFARGVPFQYNPVNQDMRICGTFASLVGVEDALDTENTVHLQMAIERSKMLMGVLMSIGGIPLIYMGEELGTLNDYSYQDNINQAQDSRWVHRTIMDWQTAPGASEHTDLQSHFYSMLKTLISARKSLKALRGTDIKLLKTRNEHLLAFERPAPAASVLVIANFSEQAQSLSGLFKDNQLPTRLRDHLSERNISSRTRLKPYAIHWCRRLATDSSV